MNTAHSALRAAFIKAAVWHGPVEEAESMLVRHPELGFDDLYVAAILGDGAAVRQILAEDPAQAVVAVEPFGGNALVYLCLSKYLRLGKRPAAGFIEAATALLDAGADANSGFWSNEGSPEFETALYGAAGVARHAGLTRMLLERGADPNDGEAVYHSPENWDNGAMKELVETGKLTPESLSMMLIRKLDWHDLEGIKYLLEHGADASRPCWMDNYPLYHALGRANGLPIVTLLLDHGASPMAVRKGVTILATAAREGRADVLLLLKERGWSIGFSGVDRLIAACALGDAAEVSASADPELRQVLLDMGGNLLGQFCINGNGAGAELLLALGVPVDAPYAEGEGYGNGYFEIPAGSLPIHIAAWRGWPDVVRLLLKRGATVDKPDAHGRTPLMLAVRACVHSYWMSRRSTASAEALLDAGASAKQITLPTGYIAMDELLLRNSDRS